MPFGTCRTAGCVDCGITFTEAAGIAMDSHNAAMALATVISTSAGKALSVVSKSGGVIGAVIGGGPALINIFNNGGTTQDWIDLGLAAVGTAFVISAPSSAIYQGAQLTIATGQLIYDIYKISDDNRCN